MPRRWNHLCRTMLGMVVAVGALTCGQARAEDAVLLSSTVPGYIPGMVISSADRLSVPDGATATLLFKSGEMLRLRGPFEGTIGQQQAGAADTGAAMLADIFRMHGVDAAVIGGTRTAGPARPGPVLDDVEVDPQHSGTYCVELVTSVWIARPAKDPDNYALRRKGSSRMLRWPPGAERMEWPQDVPIEDGSQFEITAGGSAKATLTFRGLPSGATTNAARIASGLILGCHDQFDADLRKYGRSVTMPELWITTDRGRRPTYHVGEPVALTVMANMDGYLYCVATGNDGSAMPVFPAGAMDGAQLRGSVPLSVPGRRQPAGLIMASGLAQVRCWLADRDITPELPHALVGAPSARLPDQLAGDLDALFAHINGTRIEADVLNVRTQ